MLKCECGKKFKNKAGLSSHKNWCDGENLRSEKSKSKEQINTDKLCHYGCGKKANWSLKNGKLCCSKYSSQCLSVRGKNSKGLKKAWKKDPWSTGGNTGGGWNKNLSWKEMYDKETLKSRLKWAKNKSFIAKLDKDEKSEYGKLGGGGGGYRKNSGRSKGCWYKSPIAGNVWLDSSYEVAYAEWLDENNIKWERNTKRFGYTHDGKEKKYIPDFYLINEDKYIEVKGFETKKDRAKWADFPQDLEVLKKKDLINLGCKL